MFTKGQNSALTQSPDHFKIVRYTIKIIITWELQYKTELKKTDRQGRLGIIWACALQVNSHTIMCEMWSAKSSFEPVVFGFKAQRQFRSTMSLDDGSAVQFIKITPTKYRQLLFQLLAKHCHFKNYWLHKQINLA